MNLTETLSVLRKSVLLIAAMVLIGSGAGALVALVQAPSYSASTQVFVSTQGAGSSADLAQGNSFTLSRVKTYARLATSQEVLNRVVDELQLNVSTQELAATVSAAPLLDTTIIEITVRNAEPEAASAIANAIAESLASTVAAIEAPSAGDSPIRLTTVEAAELPVSPDSPRPFLYVALGALCGLLLAIALAVLRERLDTRIRSERDLRSITDLPVVGSIPMDPKSKQRPLIVHAEPLNPRSEAFRSLRTNLQFVEVDGSARTFVVTSSLPGEGKSTTTSNLALALADAGETVILVDADLRKPKVAEYFGIDGQVGLTNVLIGSSTLVDAVQMWGDSSLYILPAGRIPPNPSELLGSRSMAALVAELEAEFDWVLFDAPPLLPVTDSAILARHTSGAIVAVAHGKATGHQLESALAVLKNVDAQPAGVALTMVPVKESTYGYGYGYGHSAGKSA